MKPQKPACKFKERAPLSPSPSLPLKKNIKKKVK